MSVYKMKWSFWLGKGSTIEGFIEADNPEEAIKLGKELDRHLAMHNGNEHQKKLFLAQLSKCFPQIII